MLDDVSPERKEIEERDARRFRIHQRILAYLEQRQKVTVAELEEKFAGEDRQDFNVARWMVLSSGKAKITLSREVEYVQGSTNNFWL